MKNINAYDLLIKEYLDKLAPIGCDRCFNEMYCAKNNLKHSKHPQDDCLQKIKDFFKERRLRCK